MVPNFALWSFQPKNVTRHLWLPFPLFSTRHVDLLSFHIEHFQSASGFAFPNAHSGILLHLHFKALWEIRPFTHVKLNAYSVKAQPSEKMLLHQFCLWVFLLLLRLYVIKSRMRRRFNYLTKRRQRKHNLKEKSSKREKNVVHFNVLGEIHKRLAMKHFASLCDHQIILKKKIMRKKVSNYRYCLSLYCICVEEWWAQHIAILQLLRKKKHAPRIPKTNSVRFHIWHL